jgi:hypothetical protein
MCRVVIHQSVMTLKQTSPKKTRPYVQSYQSARRTNDNIPKYLDVYTYLHVNIDIHINVLYSDETQNSNPVSVRWRESSESHDDTRMEQTTTTTNSQANLAFILVAIYFSPPKKMKSLEWLLIVAVTISTLLSTARAAASTTVNERDILLEFYQATGACDVPFHQSFYSS